MDFRRLESHGESLLKQGICTHLEIGYSCGAVKEFIPLGQSKADSVYDIASITKVVLTTTALMQLVDQGTISLDQKLGHYFSAAEKAIAEITLIELLTHTSGLPAWLPLFGLVPSKEAALEYLLKKVSVGKKGKRVYSDLGFMLLGFLIEEVTGNDLEHYFRFQIESPFRLAATRFQNNLADLSPVPTSTGNPYEQKLSKVYKMPLEVNWRSYQLVGEVNDYNCFKVWNGFAPHAGLFSTANDLIHFAQELLNAQHVKRETLDLFFNTSIEDNSLGYLADPNLMKFQTDEKWRGHHGFTGCTFLINPTSKEVMVFLCNRQAGGMDKGFYPDWKLK